MEYHPLKTVCEVMGREEQSFSAPERPMSNWCAIPSAKRTVNALIQLTFATKLHRMIVAGPKCVETLLELHRRGYLRVTTAALCDVPCGQFDLALVAWREHSVESLEATLSGLAHFLSTTGFHVVCVTARDQIQLLRSALRRAQSATPVSHSVRTSMRKPNRNLPGRDLQHAGTYGRAVRRGSGADRRHRARRVLWPSRAILAFFPRDRALGRSNCRESTSAM
jgi:hypothetical protein